MRNVIASILLFALTAASVQPVAAEREAPALRFFVISDIHVRSEHPQSQAKLKAALADLHGIAPDADALVINGDLTEGRPEDYRVLLRVMAESPRPARVFYTIGNHEYYQAWYDRTGAWNAAAFPNGESERDSIGRFLALTGEPRVYYARTVNGYPFMFLGSERYRQSAPDNREDACLSKRQLQWLNERLAEAAKAEKPIFVFLHQPVSDKRRGSCCCGRDRSVVQHGKLKEILSRYPRVILFAGHTHRTLRNPGAVVKDRFVMVNSSSVAQPWTNDGNNGERPLPAEESEGLYVEAYPDRVVIKGRDFYRQTWIPEAVFTFRVFRTPGLSYNR